MITRLALRNLWRHRRRTLLTMGALAVGVMAVVSVRGFLNGLQGSLITGVTEGGFGALQIHATGFMASVEAMPLSPDLPGDDAALSAVEDLDGVAAVAPRLTFPALLAGEHDSTFALVVGADLAREALVSPRRVQLVTSGAWPAGDTVHTSAVVSSDLLGGLQLQLGRRAAVLGSDIDGVMNGVEVTVAGGVAAAMQGEKRLVIIPLEKAEELIRRPGRVTEYAVAIDDGADVDVVADTIRRAMGPSVEVHTWPELMPLVRDAKSTQDGVLRVVTGALLFVIMMGLANTLLMSVFERTREIGTLLALGMKRRLVMHLFVLEGVLLGIGGAVIGDVLGTIIVTIAGRAGIALTPPGATIPQVIVPAIGPSFLIAMVAGAAIGAAIASLSPAWRASRLDPVSALADR
jgi:putative ABC transport system permease protein